MHAWRTGARDVGLTTCTTSSDKAILTSEASMPLRATAMPGRAGPVGGIPMVATYCRSVILIAFFRTVTTLHLRGRRGFLTLAVGRRSPKSRVFKHGFDVACSISVRRLRPDIEHNRETSSPPSPV
jgi:hypothetical protein